MSVKLNAVTPNPRQPLWVIGSGGLAKVIIDATRAADTFEVVGVLDDDPNKLGSQVLDVPVRGEVTPASIKQLGVTHAVIGIGATKVRAAIVERLGDALTWATVIHPTAYLSPAATLGTGSVVLARAVVHPDASLGNHVIVNNSASVAHDVVIEDFGRIAPGAHLAGHVVVKRGAFVGIGASVLPHRIVGVWAIVGGGAAVTRDVPDSATVVGVPAKKMQ